MKKVPEKLEKDFLQAYEELSSPLYRHCFFRVSSHEIAVDIVQESFTKTWKQIAQGEEIRNIRAFIYKVMNNLIIDHYRKHKSESLDALLDDRFDPTESKSQEKILNDAELNLVGKFLEQISSKDRDLVVMRFHDGLSVKEIAKFFGESENNISVRLHRALIKVRKKFNEK